MTNIVENAMSALVCGMIVRWLCSTPAAQRARPALPTTDGAIPGVQSHGDFHVRYS